MLIILAVLAIVICLAWRYPPTAVLVFALTNVGGDGFAMNSLLRLTGYETLAIWLRVSLFVGSAIACYKILSSGRNDGEMIRTKRLVLVIIGVSAWVFLAVLVKGGSIPLAFGIMMYPGFLVAPVVLAYWRDFWARVIFVAFLLIQLALAAAVVLLPETPFGMLSGTRYSEGTGLGDLSGISQTFNGGVSRVSEQPRMFAQFNDPDGYGLYAVIGIVIGMYMCFSGRSFRNRMFGGILVALAGFAYSVTVNRGTTLGLLAGLLIVGVREIATRPVARTITLWLIVVALAGTTFVVMAGNGGSSSAVGELFFVSSSDVSVTGRVDALKVGLEGIVDSPLVGVPMNFAWPDRVPPHQLMVYFAAVYGLPAGMLVTLLLWTMVEIRTQYASAGLPVSEKWLLHLGVIIGWALLGTAMTNNFSAPALFWVCWAIACTPWLFRGQEDKGRQFRRSRPMTRQRVCSTQCSPVRV